MTNQRKDLSKKELTDKIESLLMVLKATLHEPTRKETENRLKNYAMQYKETTGDWYRREWR